MALSVKKILILTANPENSTPLRLDREVREIDEALIRSKQRDRFELEQKWAVRPGDVQRAILELKPQIVHFSGHGAGEGGLALEDESGSVRLVSTEAIARLFELFADTVECVVLNACYSEVQAKAIAAHIDYVVGMDREISDRAAGEFAVGFYDAIGAGESFEFACKLGANRINLAGLEEHHIPILKRRSDRLKQKSSQDNKILPGSLEFPEGQVRIDSEFYIASIYEERCHAEVQKPGSLIRIKSPRNMGKSSLAARVLARAAQLDYRTVTIDLHQTNEKFFHDLDKFMQWFCASTGKPLGIRVKVEEYWDDIFGANDNVTDYFEKYLLSEDDRPLVLAMDNFDRVFKYVDIETDFCGLLRGWHERSRNHSLWGNLRLVIIHSQEPYLQKDINQSPFNVGLPIVLEEFTPTQVEELVKRHGLTWTSSQIEEIMGLIGGHPYLVRLALYHIAAGDLSLAEFLRVAATDAGIYRDHLSGHLKVLADRAELGEAMQSVVASETPVRLGSEEAFKLDSMGLIERVPEGVQPRCLLYRQYFRDRLEAK
ncbi:MAG: AAA-like domain-containing protein [Spirulina sp.]